MGDIIGLADKAEKSHRAVGRYAAEKGTDLLIAVGREAVYYAEGAKELMGESKVMYFPEKEDFIKVKDRVIQKGDVILVKASRGMEMEKIVNEILG